MYHTPTIEINSKAISMPLKAGKKSPFFFIKGEKMVGNPITAAAKEITQITVKIVGRFSSRMLNVIFYWLSLKNKMERQVKQ